MSTSDRAFNQVKAILNKLDRSIEEAREKRLHPGAPAPAIPVAAPTPARAPMVPPPAAPVNGTTNGSGYGRAQPMRPTNPNLQRWAN